MDIDTLEILQDEATDKVKGWLVGGLQRFVHPQKQREALIEYMRMDESVKKLMSSKHRQEMEDLRRRFDGSTGRP